jgi:mannose/fructose/N-acetylgalactosamine-specific phosphotransferase system component IID
MRAARRAADSSVARFLARAGLTARGVIYILVGWVAVLAGYWWASSWSSRARKKFMRYLQTGRMSPRMRRVVEVLGLTGTIVRGLVFALVGVLVIDAAVTHKAAESGGIDKALLTLRGAPLGEFLLLLAALGLVIFGVYGLCEARWRRV